MSNTENRVWAYQYGKRAEYVELPVVRSGGEKHPINLQSQPILDALGCQPDEVSNLLVSFYDVGRRQAVGAEIYSLEKDNVEIGSENEERWGPKYIIFPKQVRVLVIPNETVLYIPSPYNKTDLNIRVGDFESWLKKNSIARR